MTIFQRKYLRVSKPIPSNHPVTCETDGALAVYAITIPLLGLELKIEKGNRFLDFACMLTRPEYFEENDNKTEFALYRYGYAYLTGLSDRICARQTTPVLKIQRKDRSREFISYWFSHTGQMIIW